MRAIVTIGLKAGVLDVQGKAVAGALEGLGFSGVREARVGRVIELDLAETDEAAARARVTEMCDRLLANPVIEAYHIELEP